MHTDEIQFHRARHPRLCHFYSTYEHVQAHVHTNTCAYYNGSQRDFLCTWTILLLEMTIDPRYRPGVYSRFAHMLDVEEREINEDNFSRKFQTSAPIVTRLEAQL